MVRSWPAPILTKDNSTRGTNPSYKKQARKSITGFRAFLVAEPWVLWYTPSLPLVKIETEPKMAPFQTVDKVRDICRGFFSHKMPNKYDFKRLFGTFMI